MYLTIPVIISRHFDEVEAERAGVPAGKERTPEEVEFELEKLLAPYDYTTTLNISRGRRSSGKRVVPNYGAQARPEIVQRRCGARLCRSGARSS